MSRGVDPNPIRFFCIIIIYATTDAVLSLFFFLPLGIQLDAYEYTKVRKLKQETGYSS